MTERTTSMGANGGGKGANGSATLVPGFAAGVLGGLVMAGWMAAAAALDGIDPLAPLRPIGDTFADGERQARGAGVLIYGLALHVVFAGAVGVLFTAVLPRNLEPRFASVMCIGFAFAVMAVMTSYVLPAYNPSLREEMPELGGAWVLAHAAYGAAVGLFAQRFRQRRRVAEPARSDERAREGDPDRRSVASTR